MSKNLVKINHSELNNIINECIRETLFEENLNEDWKSNLKNAALGAAITTGSIAGAGALDYIGQKNNNNNNTIQHSQYNQDKEKFIKKQVLFGDIMDIVHHHEKLYGHIYNFNEIINNLNVDDSALICMADVNDETSLDRLKHFYMEYLNNCLIIERGDKLYLININEI
jgi:hypothetical protein